MFADDEVYFPTLDYPAMLELYVKLFEDFVYDPFSSRGVSFD